MRTRHAVWILVLALVVGTAGLAGAVPPQAEKGTTKASERSGRSIPAAENAETAEADAGAHETTGFDDAGVNATEGNATEEEEQPGDANVTSEEDSHRGKGLANAMQHVPEHVAAKLAAMQAAMADGVKGLGEVLRAFREAGTQETPDEDGETERGRPETAGKEAGRGKPEAAGNEGERGQPASEGEPERGRGLEKAAGRVPERVAARLAAISAALGETLGGVGAAIAALRG